MKSKIFLTVFALLIISACVSSSVGRRRSRRPPSGFGRGADDQQSGYGQEQDFGDLGQSTDVQHSNDNDLEYGGLQSQSQIPQSSQSRYEDDDDGDIQQVNRDTEDFSGFLQKPNPNQNQVGFEEPPPKYTQEPGNNGQLVDVPKNIAPEAVTPKGTFNGFKQTVNGVDVYVFYGVPYAKPPVGNRRFKKPETCDRLTEPYDATHLPNACTQTVSDVFNGFAGELEWNPNTNVSEDCLYLNIWVPAKVFEKKETELVPVIYWIHGGGFFSGSISLDVYNGAVLASTQEVVVVNVQYRLGPLGFLYFGTDDAPGNMGLLDQALGLRWVRENIEYFGGDPDSVTAAGESCGSASVGFHLVSPLSKSYIKRGIMTSGLPSAIYALKPQEEMKSRSLQLAKLSGCDQKDLKEIADCLRKVEGDKLVANQWKLYKTMLDFPFSPTVDGYFLLDHPDNVIKKERAKRADLIMGTVRDEGTFFLVYHYLNYFSHLRPTSVPYDRFVDIMNELFQLYSEIDREAIINKYTNWENPEDGYENQRKIGEAIADGYFVCPHRKFADAWSNRGISVYYYHFTERFSSNPWGQWMGVMHGDDIPLFFGEPLIDNKATAGEKKVSQKMMEMVGNFAKVGVPSNKWERYTSEHPVYLDLNATVVSDVTNPQLHGPRASECAFWNKLLPMIHRNADAQCHSNQHFGNMRQPEVPQQEWNDHGQGIHGGPGFHFNNMNANPQTQQQPLCNPYPQANPMYFSPTPHYHYPPQVAQNYRGNECSSNPTNTPPPPYPTATSCKCTVQESSSSNTNSQQSQYVTPPPAIY